MPSFHLNSFATRHTAESRFSHFDGSKERLLTIVAESFPNAVKGYRDGVLVVPVPPGGFKSSVVTLQSGDVLRGVYEARRAGETPRQSCGLDVPEGERASRKTDAVLCDIILYASTLLAEEGSNELPDDEDGNWEIISINAASVTGEQPIEPMTLLHNHFGSDGGTATGMTPEQLEAALKVSMAYWKDKTMLA